MARFDLYVIGGGSGGVACGRRAAAYGAKVGLAESSRVGGTCVIRGCVPKKLMHYGAHFAEMFRLAKGYGWRLGEAPVLDFQALIEARNTEIQRLNDIYLGMLDRAGVTVHADRANVLGRTADGAFRIAVGGAEHEATNLLVAVGARPAKPVLPGVEHTVTVLADGYEWQGRPYRSLSAIARAITGTRWNGPLFFGLRNHRSAA